MRTSGPVMGSPQDDYEVGPLAREQFAVSMCIGRSAAPRIDMGSNQSAQRSTVAGRLRNLPGTSGSVKERLDFAAQLDRFVLIAETGERGRALRITHERV